MDIKNIIYAITCIVFCAIIGAAFYEHVAVWPRAFEAPPVSLAMFQGKYGLHPTPFWMVIHPIALALFIICLIVFWKSNRRKNILIAFGGYVVILIFTFLYFVPQLMSIVNTAYRNTADELLTKNANRWVMLSIVRLIALNVLSVILLLGFIKPNHKN